MTTSVDRFQLLDQSQLLFPFKCSVCGSFGLSERDTRKFLDFSLNIEFFGKVYICTECLVSAAQTVGYVPIDAFNKVNHTLVECREVIKTLLSENRGLRDAVDSIRLINSSEPVSVVIPNSETTPEIERNPEHTEQPVQQRTKRKSRSSEQINEPGSSLVHSDDSDPLTELGLNI